MKEVNFTFPFPPSVNAYWRSPGKGKVLVSEAGRKFRTAVYQTVLDKLRRRPAPLKGDLQVVMVLNQPDKRRRDIDNYCKALFDALTYTGVWADDSQIKRMTVEWGEQAKGGSVQITINGYQK